MPAVAARFIWVAGAQMVMAAHQSGTGDPSCSLRKPENAAKDIDFGFVLALVQC